MPSSYSSLESGRVRLSPVVPGDLPKLFEWHSDTRALHLWRPDRYILSYNEFVADFDQRLRTYYQTFFVIHDLEAADLPEAVGFVFTYNTSHIDQYTYSGIFLSDEHAGKGIAKTASFLLANYAFSYFGFRKIYAEVYGYNIKSQQILASHGFIEECRLPKHRLFDNSFWDLHVFALYKETFAKMWPPT